MSNNSPEWECYRLSNVSKVGEWRKVLEQCLESPNFPYRYDIFNNSLRIWDLADLDVKVPNSNYVCRNGYELQKLDFGKLKGEVLIGITICRLVFEPGSKFPTFFSAAELFTKGKYPDVLRHQPMIMGISRLIESLNRVLLGRQLEKYQKYQVANHACRISYTFGNHATSLSKITEYPGLSKKLLEAVRSRTSAIPSDVSLGILSLGITDSSQALQIGNEVVKILRGWGCHTSLSDLKDGNRIETFLSNVTKGQPVILIPLDGKKGDRPPDQTMQWLKYLSEIKVAFQLCSTLSNPAYTRHGLAISTLSKASGAIFITEPLDFPNFRHSWFIGIDIGKGGRYKGKVVAITLTSPEGSLQAHWRASKNEDETLSKEMLSEGLSWIVSKAESLSAGRNLYLIRDGLRPLNESLDLYHTALPNHSFTLIEYAKSGSPLIHCGSSEPEAGTTIMIEDSAFTALYPCNSPQSGVLTSPVKFRTSNNPNNHSPSDIASLLTALCHSATLSYQPSRTPAPIYWANGLASLSYTNLQFSGWSHRDSKLLNLET